MKKFLLSLVSLLMFAIGSAWADDVTLTAVTNAQTCTVNEIAGIKVGTSSKAGDMTITVPANTTKLTFYAAAWKGATGTSVSITGATADPSSLDLTANDGISNNSPFTLSDGTNLGDYMFEVVLSDVTEETTLTLTSDKRFVVWDASAEVDSEDPVDPYDAALAAIGDGGTYFISSDVNGTKYYITADGKLTSTRADGCIFTLTKVEGNGFKQYGYYIDGGKRFTNGPLSNNQATLNVSSYSTSTNNRAQWEAQVLLLQDGKYAIRTCNTEHATSSWGDAGRTFFSWKVDDVAIPQYTYDEAYLWNLEAATPINVTYKLVESDGTTEASSVAKKQEANSEISLPSAFTSDFRYTYAVEGTIGTEDCTITVTRTMKPMVHALTDLSNAKAYNIGCDRGAFTIYDGHVASTAKFAGAELGKFAVIYYDETDDETSNGSYYLYSVADKKFVLNNAALSIMPTHGIFDAIQMEAKTDPYFFYYYKISAETNNGFNTNGSGTYGCAVDGWMSVDAGNQYYMVEAGEFDATEALAVLDACFHPANFVTYVVKDAAGNVLFTSEPAPALPGSKITTLPAEYQRDFTTYNEVDVTITEAETTVEFTATSTFPFELSTDFANAKWYNMNIRSGKWIAMDETEPYSPKADKDLTAAASQWAFTGSAYGISIINKAAGADKTLTKVESNVVMREGAYVWEIFKNSDGFVLREAGTDNNFINQNGGADGDLKFWNNGGAKTDDGSTFRVQAVPEVELAAPTFNVEEGTQAAPNKLAAGSTLKINYTASNLDVNGYNADDLKVKVTVLLSGDLPENLMTMGSETAHRVQGASFYIPLGETDFPVALKPGYVYQNIVIVSAELVKNAETDSEEAIASYAGAPVQLHWVGLEAKVIYIETDMTSQFASLTNKDNWTTGAGGKAGYTETKYCPAVTPNGLPEVQVCEFYESNCDRTGDLLYQTVTGLTEGTYTIELYGGAAYTFGRGFSSEAFSTGTWNAGDKITENTGVTLYATTSEGTFGGEIPIYYATDFPDGAAVVTLEGVTVGSNGEVKIGMSKTSKSTNWHVVQLKSVIATVDAKALLATSVAAANAIDKATIPTALATKLDNTVAENNKSYDTADDYQAAINAIDAVVADAKAYAPLTAALAQGEVYKAHVAEGNEAITTYETAIADVVTAYEAATVADMAAAIATVEAALPALAKAQTLAGADLTVFITNPTIDGSANGWTLNAPVGGGGPLKPSKDALEYWGGSANPRSEAQFDIYQELTGLPNGIYTISADLFNSLNDEDGASFAPTAGVYGASGDSESYKLVDVEGTELNTYTTDQIFVFDGTLRIGFKSIAPVAARWFVADNFKLTLVRPLDENADAPYFAALKSIENGAVYRIKATVNEETFYLQPTGYLTSDQNAAGGFQISQAEGGALYNIGFLVDGGNARFSNPPGTNEDNLKCGHISTSDAKRADYDAQVFFKNAEGKYAVRSTNVAAGATSGWAWVASSYWTIEKPEEDYVAQYQWDPAYIWELEYVCDAETYAARIAASEIVKTWVNTIQVAKGLVTEGSQWISNAKDPSEGSYDALVDGDYATFFHSTWHGGEYDPQADHYLQATLPEAQTDFYFYFKKRQQNNNNRPTKIVIEGSNDGETFAPITEITEGLPTDASVIDYLSAKISSETAYKTIRFTVPETNNGAKTGDHVFFTFSEFYILPANIPAAAAALDLVGTPTYMLDAAQVKTVDETLKSVLNTVKVTYELWETEGTEPIQTATAVQEGGSEVKIPAAFITAGYYDYTAEAETVGTEDCTIKVVRTVKPGLIMALNELKANKAYTIACDRGALLTKDDFLASTGHNSLTNAEPANFAIVYYDETEDETENGSYYLYSVADKKFVTNTGALAAMPTNGVKDAIQMEVKDGWNAPYFMYYFTVAEGTNYGLNTNGNDPYGYVINSWMNADGGNMYYMIEAADFDATEALAALYAYYNPSYYVTYVVKDAAGNELFKSEPAPTMLGTKITTLPAEYQRAFTTYNEVDVTIAEENTTVEFTATSTFPFELSTDFATAKWYNMTIRGDYWVGTEGKEDGEGIPVAEPYYPVQKTDDDAALLVKPAYQWAFSGDAYNGIIVWNKGAGAGFTLTRIEGEKANDDGDDYALMREGDYAWTIGKNGDGFTLRVIGSSNQCINQYGGATGHIGFWTADGALADNGSTFRIFEVPAADPVEFTIKENMNKTGIGSGTQTAPTKVKIDTPFKLQATAKNKAANNLNDEDLTIHFDMIAIAAFKDAAMSDMTGLNRVMMQDVNVPYAQYFTVPIEFSEAYPFIQSITFVGAKLMKGDEVIDEVDVEQPGAPALVVRFLEIVDKDGNPVGIKSIFDENVENVFDLSGRKVQKVQKGRAYIIDGKKAVIRKK